MPSLNKVYGETTSADGEAASTAHPGKTFEIAQPSTGETIGMEGHRSASLLLHSEPCPCCTENAARISQPDGIGKKRNSHGRTRKSDALFILPMPFGRMESSRQRD
jgi:hypothetical protein